MDSKVKLVVLDGLNYIVGATNMVALLKSKGLFQYTKVYILDLSNDQEKFFIDINKYEAIGVITTYISQDIYFQMSGINYPHEVSKKLKSLFDKVEKNQVMQIE